jgi:hypothetical protein
VGVTNASVTIKKDMSDSLVLTRNKGDDDHAVRTLHDMSDFPALPGAYNALFLYIEPGKSAHSLLISSLI